MVFPPRAINILPKAFFVLIFWKCEGESNPSGILHFNFACSSLVHKNHNLIRVYQDSPKTHGPGYLKSPRRITNSPKASMAKKTVSRGAGIVLIDGLGPGTPVMVPIAHPLGRGGGQPASHRHKKTGFGALQPASGKGVSSVPAMSNFPGRWFEAIRGAICSTARYPPAAPGFPKNGPSRPNRPPAGVDSAYTIPFPGPKPSENPPEVGDSFFQAHQRLQLFPAGPGQIGVHDFRQFPGHK